MTKNKKTLLIVDDDSALLTALESKFKKEGFNVFTARDGEEGLALALSQHPDMTLLDIIMPKMDGITMLKKLREDKWGQEAPVILLTNIDDNTRVADAVFSGAFDYLVKSDWKIDDVLVKVKQRLRMV